MIGKSCGRITALFACLLAYSAPAGAEDKPDLSTPKKSASAFAVAVQCGDMATVKAVSIGEEEDYKIIESLSHLLDAGHKLQEAAVAKFGEPGKQATQDVQSDFAHHIEEGEEHVDGQTASIGGRDRQDPLKLKKVDRDWKVDLSTFRQREQLQSVVPKIQKVMTDTTAGIESGRYKTPQEVREVLKQQVSAIITAELIHNALREHAARKQQQQQQQSSGQQK